MAYLLFTLYFVLLSWLITKSAFIHKTGISKSGLIALFTVKLLSGVLYGYLYSRPGFIQGADTWQIYFESVKETKILLGDPIRFLASLFANPDQLSFTGFSESDHSYWNNLKDNLLIKAEAVMNLFSGGYYYTNVVIYSFITFYGSITFYRTLNELYSGRKISKIIAAFLLPSFLFWTSGFYKDGVLFLFISLIIYHSNRWIMERNGGWKRFSIVMTSVIIIFLLRNYVAFLLIPALSGWLISATFKKGIYVFATIYLLLTLFVITSGHLHSSLNIPRIIASWQTGFLKLPAKSAIPVEKLEPSGLGLIENLPQALNVGFLRPYLWENKGLQYVPYAMEIAATIVLLCVFFRYRERPTPQQQVFFYFCLFLTGSAWILLGYTVNILGALVRYKAIFYPLVIAPLICSVSESWYKIHYK
ncbi:MAG: hypothetical protein WKF97_06515 [Chitinophagaceae bacterium]